MIWLFFQLELDVPIGVDDDCGSDAAEQLEVQHVYWRRILQGPSDPLGFIIFAV